METVDLASGNAAAAPPKLRLAHLVNVFLPPSGSEFEWVQPITLETMRLARQAAAAAVPSVEVTLLTAQFAHDRQVVPHDFVATPDLLRSVRDVYQDPSLPPLPLIADLLDRLYHASEADYLIYTNIDIALQPQFYSAVAGFIAQGHDAFIINRRRIPGHFRSVDELPAMFATPGLPHPGFDCFVFHRSLFPQFVLGNVCIGIPFIEILMGQNLFCHAQRFILLENEYLTFHIGEEIFKPRHGFLLQQNRLAFWAAIQILWPLLDSRKFPYGELWFLRRYWKWGLHPCIPIRLCILLETRRLRGKRNGR